MRKGASRSNFAETHGATAPRYGRAKRRDSADQFDLAQPPLLREEGFERAVETKEREPTLAGPQTGRTDQGVAPRRGAHAHARVKLLAFLGM
jgi:hypothetical protein